MDVEDRRLWRIGMDAGGAVGVDGRRDRDGVLAVGGHPLSDRRTGGAGSAMVSLHFDANVVRYRI
ncbi:hypothetical protein ACFQX6_14105 [Streptosporangium lutulentum]